jgi:transposase
MQAYSRLKRLAVLAARDADKPTSEVAKKYGVSPGWVRRVVQQRRELGKYGPYKFRRRDRRSAPLSRRVIYMIMEDPRLTIKELERVLGTKLSINLLEGVKNELDISHRVRWYGGLDTEFVLSPSGNYLTQSRTPAICWELEQEIERLKAGEPARIKPTLPVDWRERIDTKKYPMV